MEHSGLSGHTYLFPFYNWMSYFKILIFFLFQYLAFLFLSFFPQSVFFKFFLPLTTSSIGHLKGYRVPYCPLACPLASFLSLQTGSSPLVYAGFLCSIQFSMNSISWSFKQHLTVTLFVLPCNYSSTVSFTKLWAQWRLGQCFNLPTMASPQCGTRPSIQLAPYENLLDQ